MCMPGAVWSRCFVSVCVNIECEIKPVQGRVTIGSHIFQSHADVYPHICQKPSVPDHHHWVEKLKRP